MKDLKKHTILYISIVIILVSITASVSYSYVIAKITNSKTPTASTATSGTLDISFTTSEYISATDMGLIDADDVLTDAPKTSFTIAHSSSSNVYTKYNLYLTDITISDNFKSKYFKWALYKGSSTTALYSGNFASYSSGNILLTTAAQGLSVGTTDSYTLRIWIENDTSVNQISLVSGSFKGKVKVEATSYNGQS